MSSLTFTVAVSVSAIIAGPPLQNLALQNLALQNLALQNLALQNLALQNLALQNLALQNLALQNLASIRTGEWSGYFDRDGHSTRVAAVQRRELLDASPTDLGDHAFGDPPVEVADQLGIGLGQLPERAVEKGDVDAVTGQDL